MTREEMPSPDGEKLTRRQAVEFALNDPVARSTGQTPLVERRMQLYAEAAQGVLADLSAAGFPGLEEVGELRTRGREYKAAVPLLLHWLPKVSYLMLVEDIIRTLSVRFAKNAALPEFLRLFRDPPTVQDPIRPPTSPPLAEHIRWVIGNGLGIFADPSMADDLIELARARRFGEARSEIVAALPKTKDERVPGVLLDLLDDPTVSTSAIEALGKMRFVQARPRIEAMLDHHDENVRDQAKKALKRLG